MECCVPLCNIINQTNQSEGKGYYPIMGNDDWFASKEYENVCSTIGKCRKQLYELFNANQVVKGYVSVEGAKKALEKVLVGRTFTDAQWDALIGIGVEDGRVNYKKLLLIYKQRCTNKNQFPLSAVMRTKTNNPFA
jgi:hypothetical protein